MFFKGVESVHCKISRAVKDVGAPPANSKETIFEQGGPECGCIVVGIDNVDCASAGRLGEDVLR